MENRTLTIKAALKMRRSDPGHFDDGKPVSGEVPWGAILLRLSSDRFDLAHGSHEWGRRWGRSTRRADGPCRSRALFAGERGRPGSTSGWLRGFVKVKNVSGPPRRRDPDGAPLPPTTTFLWKEVAARPCSTANRVRGFKAKSQASLLHEPPPERENNRCAGDRDCQRCCNQFRPFPDPLLFSRGSFRVRTSPTWATTHDPPILRRIPPGWRCHFEWSLRPSFNRMASMSSA